MRSSSCLTSPHRRINLYSVGLFLKVFCAFLSLCLLISCASNRRALDIPDECGNSFGRKYNNTTTLRGLGTIFALDDPEGINASIVRWIDSTVMDSICGGQCFVSGPFDVPSCYYFRERKLTGGILGLGGSRNDSLSVSVQPVTLRVIELRPQCRDSLDKIIEAEARKLKVEKDKIRPYAGAWALVNRVWVADTFHVEIRRTQGSSISFLKELPPQDSVRAVVRGIIGEVANTANFELSKRDTLYVVYNVSAKGAPRYVRYDIYPWFLPEHRGKIGIQMELRGAMGSVWEQEGTSVVDWMPTGGIGFGLVQHSGYERKLGLFAEGEFESYNQGWLMKAMIVPRLYWPQPFAIDVLIGNAWGKINGVENWGRHGWLVGARATTELPKFPQVRLGLQSAFQQTHEVRSDGSRGPGYWYWAHSVVVVVSPFASSGLNH